MADGEKQNAGKVESGAGNNDPFEAFEILAAATPTAGAPSVIDDNNVANGTGEDSSADREAEAEEGAGAMVTNSASLIGSLIDEDSTSAAEVGEEEVQSFENTSSNTPSTLIDDFIADLDSNAEIDLVSTKLEMEMGTGQGVDGEVDTTADLLDDFADFSTATKQSTEEKVGPESSTAKKGTEDDFADFNSATEPEPEPTAELEEGPLEGDNEFTGSSTAHKAAAGPELNIGLDLETKSTGGNNDFADFAEADPEPKLTAVSKLELEQSREDDFDAFANVDAAPVAALEPDSVVDAEPPKGDEDFADFSAAPEPELEAALEPAEKDDKFGDFAEFTAAASEPEPEPEPSKGGDNFDDFTDFSAAATIESDPAPEPVSETTDPTKHGSTEEEEIDDFVDIVDTPALEPEPEINLEREPELAKENDEFGDFAEFAAAPEAGSGLDSVVEAVTSTEDDFEGEFEDFSAAPEAKKDAKDDNGAGAEHDDDDDFGDFDEAPQASTPTPASAPMPSVTIIAEKGIASAVGAEVAEGVRGPCRDEETLSRLGVLPEGVHLDQYRQARANIDAILGTTDTAAGVSGKQAIERDGEVKMLLSEIDSSIKKSAGRRVPITTAWSLETISAAIVATIPPDAIPAEEFEEEEATRQRTRTRSAGGTGSPTMGTSSKLERTSSFESPESEDLSNGAAGISFARDKEGTGTKTKTGRESPGPHADIGVAPAAPSIKPPSTYSNGTPLEPFPAGSAATGADLVPAFEEDGLSGAVGEFLRGLPDLSFMVK